MADGEHRLYTVAKNLPWVLYDSDMSHRCDGGLELASYLNGCKRPAYWYFTKVGQSAAKDGWFCWDHLISKCLYADGVEQARLDVWMIENGYREETRT